MASLRVRRSVAATASLTIALLGGLLLAPAPVAACDLCAIYTGSLMQQEKTGPMLGIAEQYTYFGSVREGEHSSPNPGNEWLKSSITQIVLGYAITPRISVQANIPLISREYRRLEDGAPTRGEVGGLGDISIIARFSPLSRAISTTLVHIELFAGIKTPTGDSDRLSEELEEDHDGLEAVSRPVTSNSVVHPTHEEHEHESAVHGHDLALGSGSVDGVFGATVHASWKRLFGEGSLQYVVRGNGDFGYEFDDDLTWDAGPGVYAVARDTWTASLRAIASGEYKGKDKQQGAVAEDTAITAVYLGPGADLTWKSSLHASFAVDVPVLQDVSSRQIVPDYRLRAGIVWHF